VSSPHSDMQTSGSLGAFERASTVLAEYMTPEELASELGICKRTLDRWHSGRTGPPRINVGRKPLYRRSAVAEWLRSRERNFDELKSARPRRAAGR
jgi:excisionase family DNA binding protein